MAMTHQIVSFFPTLVSLVGYEHAAGFHPPARARIAQLQRTGGTTKPGQWQSGSDLHRDPVFADFAAFALRAAADRFEALRYRPSPLAFTGMWANINTPGFAHPAHAHSNNFLSGVYYLTVPEGGGGLVFLDPRKQQQVLVPSLIEVTPMNSTAARLPAVEGQMVLFPSWLEHYTEENRAQLPRVSIAFNLMLTGGFGSPESFAAGYVEPIS
ncbi:MAG: hypothetical protein HYR63_18345 [Proteobacteria bacterium]|nr:hypothetical protein [Pseudomonadota bacterium]MBI3499504.1 hypothetical protein [Pseudomonadota bacterium]